MNVSTYCSWMFPVPCLRFRQRVSASEQPCYWPADPEGDLAWLKLSLYTRHMVQVAFWSKSVITRSVLLTWFVIASTDSYRQWIRNSGERPSVCGRNQTGNVRGAKNGRSGDGRSGPGYPEWAHGARDETQAPAHPCPPLHTCQAPGTCWSHQSSVGQHHTLHEVALVDETLYHR